MRNFASPVLCALQTRFSDLKKQTVLQSGEKKRSSSKMSLKDLGPVSRKARKLLGPEGKF